MKYLSSIFVLLVAFSGCVKTEFDEPPVSEACTMEPTMTIADLKAMHSPGQAEIIPAGTVISGLVVADDESGNFYRNIILEDGSAGIEVRFNVTDLYNEFPVGRQISLVLDSLILSDYNGVTQIGEIQEAMLDTRICKGEPDQPVVPEVVTMDQLDESYISRLVTIESVQFATSSANATWADAVNLLSVNHTLEECASGEELVVRSSGFADFAAARTPTGSGSITGVYSVFGTTRQFYIRNLDDVNMEMDRCDGTGGPALTSLNEDFQSLGDDDDILLQGWFNTPVEGTRLWRAQEFGGNVYAQATAFSDNNPEMEVWLITPALDLSVVTTLNFRNAQAFYTHDGLSVFISTDFTGFNLQEATWEELSFNKATSGTSNYAFVDSGDVDISSYEGTGYIAFRYIGNPDDQTTSWIIDDVIVE